MRARGCYLCTFLSIYSIFPVRHLLLGGRCHCRGVGGCVEISLGAHVWSGVSPCVSVFAWLFSWRSFPSSVGNPLLLTAFMTQDARITTCAADGRCLLLSKHPLDSSCHVRTTRNRGKGGANMSNHRVMIPWDWAR